MQRYQCNVLVKMFPIIIVMHTCKNSCSLGDKIMIKVGNSLLDEV